MSCNVCPVAIPETVRKHKDPITGNSFIVCLVRHVHSITLNFLFRKKALFDALSNVSKLTFDLSVILVITVIAGNRINNVGSLFFPNRILRFGKNMPQSLKRLGVALCSFVSR